MVTKAGRPSMVELSSSLACCKTVLVYSVPNEAMAAMLVVTILVNDSSILAALPSYCVSKDRSSVVRASTKTTKHTPRQARPSTQRTAMRRRETEVVSLEASLGAIGSLFLLFPLEGTSVRLYCSSRTLCPCTSPLEGLEDASFMADESLVSEEGKVKSLGTYSADTKSRKQPQGKDTAVLCREVKELL